MSRPLAKVKPARRDAEGNCTDWRCTRMGGDYKAGDWGKCVGYHCPHCDTPTGMMGHRCPKDPDPDGLGCVAIQGGDAPTEEIATEPELQVTTIPNMLFADPEGKARMDRLQAAEEHNRRALEDSLTPEALAQHDAMLAKFEADLLGLPTEEAP